jgi:hypothetical protein
VFFLLSPNPGALTAATCSPIFSLNKETAMIFMHFLFDGLECVGHSFAYVVHFFIFERCLDSSCRSKQSRYQFTHPSIDNGTLPKGYEKR